MTINTSRARYAFTARRTCNGKPVCVYREYDNVAQAEADRCIFSLAGWTVGETFIDRSSHAGGRIPMCTA